MLSDVCISRLCDAQLLYIMITNPGLILLAALPSVSVVPFVIDLLGIPGRIWSIEE